MTISLRQTYGNVNLCWPNYVIIAASWQENIITSPLVLHSITYILHSQTGMGIEKHTGQLSKKKKLKIVIIFLSISLNMCFGCSKNSLIETVLLSTHNICFG